MSLLSGNFRDVILFFFNVFFRITEPAEHAFSTNNKSIMLDVDIIKICDLNEIKTNPYKRKKCRETLGICEFEFEANLSYLYSLPY